MTRFFLLCKRQLLQPSFLLFCFLLPVISLIAAYLSQAPSPSLSIGLYKEKETGTALTSSDAALIDNIFSTLSKTNTNGSYTFQIYSDKNTMLNQVANNQIDCAYIFPSDLHTKLLKNNYKNCITCYRSPSTLMAELSRETIFAVLFYEIGNDIALDYMKEACIFSSAQQKALQDFSVLYENYKTSNKVFSIDYQYLNTLSANSPTKTPPSTITMPVRGFIAILLFISGLSGGITSLSDKKNKLPVSNIATILIPLIFMALSSFLSLLLTGEIKNWGKELVILGIYGLLILLFIQFLLFFIKKPEVLAASIPFFTFGSLIFCPILVNLSTAIPFFRIMEKFFIPYYYLVLCM